MRARPDSHATNAPRPGPNGVGPFDSHRRRGRLRAQGTSFSPCEWAVAKTLADSGHDVLLRQQPKDAVHQLSDLLVDGVPFDVYSPWTSRPNSIVSAIASKGPQVRGGGVVVDLCRTSVTSAELGDVQRRVRNVTSRVRSVFVIDGPHRPRSRRSGLKTR